MREGMPPPGRENPGLCEKAGPLPRRRGPEHGPQVGDPTWRKPRQRGGGEGVGGGSQARNRSLKHPSHLMALKKTMDPLLFLGEEVGS